MVNKTRAKLKVFSFSLHTKSAHQRQHACHTFFFFFPKQIAPQRESRANKAVIKKKKKMT